MSTLDLMSDVATLTARVCDLESVSGNERALADAVESALRACPHLRVDRDGDAVVARTTLGRARRVVIAGHLDTVPLADNLPTRLVGGVLHGRGTVDMKGGVAVALHLAATVQEPHDDVTYVFYDNEEIASARNGLGRLVRDHRDWVSGDFAILMEPTNGEIEGGCNGTLRAEIRTHGETAHSARAWMGSNAIHKAAPILAALAAYEPATLDVNGLAYREGLNAVAISGGVAGNVIPDECVVTVNYRFAPSRSVEEATAHVRALLPDFDVTVVDAAGGARPGLDDPAAVAFMRAVGGAALPKYGWTDVARFSELGVPAVNYGPGDPLLAHKDDERVDVEQIRRVAERLRVWLTR